MSTAITWRPEDLLTSPKATTLLRDEAFESRLSSLRDVALELLNAVESLKGANAGRGNRSLNLPEEVRHFETDLIQAALVKTGGNQLRAARLLGLKHTTLNAKIKRYGISIRPFAAQNGEQEIAA